MKITILTLCLTFGSLAQANPYGRFRYPRHPRPPQRIEVDVDVDVEHHHRCEFTTNDALIASRTGEFGPCVITQPLRLTEKWQSYPRMPGNPYPVRVWEGRYSRTRTLEYTYERVVVDCRGREISRTQFGRVADDRADFTISNPNLSPSISQSFLLAPLTDAEAAGEMAKARSRCELSP